MFEWPMSQGPNVNWIKRARWVQDGKYVTASGVSAGKDQIDTELSVIVWEKVENTHNFIPFVGYCRN